MTGRRPGADDGRELLAGGRACANTSYQTYLGLPWCSAVASVTSAELDSDLAELTCVNPNYWFCYMTALASVTGLEYLTGTQTMQATFFGCTALTELDLRGFDPSSLTLITLMFRSCSALTTIYADADWELPSGMSGSNVFYGCSSLVGGNGTTYSATKVSYKYFVIDSEDAEGYLTAG